MAHVCGVELNYDIVTTSESEAIVPWFLSNTFFAFYFAVSNTSTKLERDESSVPSSTQRSAEYILSYDSSWEPNLIRENLLLNLIL